MKMNLHRAQELIVPLRKGTANGISEHWQARLIEALEYVIEHDSQPTPRAPDRLRDAAKLSERKTVHEWLNDAGIVSEENGKPICLLRRLRIAIDLISQNGGR